MGSERYFVFEAENDFNLEKFKEFYELFLIKHFDQIPSGTSYFDRISRDSIRKFIEKKIKEAYLPKEGTFKPNIIALPFRNRNYDFLHISPNFFNYYPDYGEQFTGYYIEIFGSTDRYNAEDEYSLGFLGLIKEIHLMTGWKGTGGLDTDDDKGEPHNFFDMKLVHSANIFPPEEVTKYGRDFFLKAPAEVIEELPNGGIFMMIERASFGSTLKERSKLREYLSNAKKR
ncbi:hypothetical protein HYU13_03205 [Candidatus Woesearchaeota archaeon]|nr:hypothetical protein [Candidatus Woesearchaeota archaeon]